MPLKYNLNEIHLSLSKNEIEDDNNLKELLNHLCDNKTQYKKILNQSYSLSPELGNNSYMNVYSWLVKKNLNHHFKKLLSEIELSAEVKPNRNIVEFLLERDNLQKYKKLIIKHIINQNIPYKEWAGTPEILMDGGVFNGSNSNTLVPLVIQILLSRLSDSNQDFFLKIETDIGLQGINEFLIRNISLLGFNHIEKLAEYIKVKTEYIGNLKSDLSKILYVIGNNQSQPLRDNFNESQLVFKSGYIESLFAQSEQLILQDDSRPHKLQKTIKIKL